MRYVLVGLGVVTVALAVALAWEQQWWAAIPDGAFGIGVAWVAWASLQEERQQGSTPDQTESARTDAGEAATTPILPEPAPSAPPTAPSVRPLPLRPRPKRNRGRKRRGG